MRTRVLTAGAAVSAVFMISAASVSAEEVFPFKGLSASHLQGISALGSTGGDPFASLTMVNRTRLAASNSGLRLRNSVKGAGTSMTSTGSVQDIHVEGVQGITVIAVNTGLNSTIQQSVSVNIVTLPKTE